MVLLLEVILLFISEGQVRSLCNVGIFFNNLKPAALFEILGFHRKVNQNFQGNNFSPSVSTVIGRVNWNALDATTELIAATFARDETGPTTSQSVVELVHLLEIL